MGANRKLLLQLARSEPFRLRDARELRPRRGRDGQRLSGRRLFQSQPVQDARCRQPLAEELQQPRKHAGQSGGKRKRRVSLCISVPKDYSSAFGCPGRQVVLRAILTLLSYQFSLTFPLVQNSPVTSTLPTRSPVGYPLF